MLAKNFLDFIVHCLHFLSQTMSLGIPSLKAHGHTKRLSSGWPAISHFCQKPPTLHLTDQCVISLRLHSYFSYISVQSVSCANLQYPRHNKYGRTPLTRINRDGEPSHMQKIRIIGFFLKNRLH